MQQVSVRTNLHLLDIIFIADGLALGAAAGLSKTDVEFVIFIAIMLHKVRYTLYTSNSQFCEVVPI